MKRRVKKCFVACLVMCMLLTMLPVLGASAAAPALDVITDVEYKTVQINGTVPELANRQVSIMIMDPAFNGDFSTVFDHLDQIVGMDQVLVAADGTFTYSTVLADAVTKEGYYVFVNGGAVNTQFAFEEPYTVLAGEQITLPIIVKNGEDLSGLKGVLNYDSNLWIFESLSSADGFRMQFQDNRFISLTADGMGVNGDDIIAGYVLLTAKGDLLDDALTTVSFDVLEAFNEARDDISVRCKSLKVNILLDVMPGDVDLNGVVNLKDAILLLQYLSQNADLNARQLRAADILADNLVNTADVVVIMQMSL